MKKIIERIQYLVHIKPEDHIKIVESNAQSNNIKAEEIENYFIENLGCTVSEYAEITEEVISEIGIGGLLARGVNAITRAISGRNILNIKPTKFNVDKPAALKLNPFSGAIDTLRSKLQLGAIGIKGKRRAQTRNDQRESFRDLEAGWADFKERTASKENTKGNLKNFLASNFNPIETTKENIEKIFSTPDFSKLVYDDKETRDILMQFMNRNFDLINDINLGKETEVLKDFKIKLASKVNRDPKLKDKADKVIAKIKRNEDASEVLKILQDLSKAEQDLVLSFVEVK